MTGYVADLVSLQDFRERIGMFSNDKWYEYFCSTLFSYLDSCHSQEDKISCLQKLITELKVDREAQILSQDMSHKIVYFEDPFDRQ